MKLHTFFFNEYYKLVYLKFFGCVDWAMNAVPRYRNKGENVMEAHCSQCCHYFSPCSYKTVTTTYRFSMPNFSLKTQFPFMMKHSYSSSLHSIVYQVFHFNTFCVPVLIFTIQISKFIIRITCKIIQFVSE